MVPSLAKTLLLTHCLAVSSLVQGLSETGHSLCPCIDIMPPLLPEEIELLVTEVGVANTSSYGVGCNSHDIGTTVCNDYEDCREVPSFLPLDTDPPSCTQNWCSRNWCYIDPNNCDKLVKKFSDYLPESGLWYSYATCGELDSFTNTTRLNALRNQTFNVGFNHNSGGWTGSYSQKKQHFIGPGTAWSGPAVEFVREAARIGNFRVNLTVPPAELKNKSLEYFSASMFDYCVYATALGYLDFCVAKYTVTDQRAVTADWFLLDSTPLYMVIMDEEEKTGLEVFKQKFLTIFLPFSGGTWLLIMFGFLPFLAFSILFQELGAEGSDFPTKEKKIVENENDLGPEEIEVPYPMWKNIVRALYRSQLSYLRRFYGQQVVTYGGSWTVLAFCFIGMIGMSLYTAQMAAHLTTEALAVRIDSLEDAIRQGYTFCGERKSVDTIMNNYNIGNRFVRDPVELGGDNLPGFNCPNCNALRRTIERLDPVLAKTDSSYCHAAIVALDDLEVFQAEGLHCNKIISGQPLSYVSNGFPLSSGHSKELLSLFLTLKNKGVYEKKKQEGRPESTCPIAQPKAKSLTPYDLIGIWIVCSGFAIIGLITSFFERRHAVKQGAKALVDTSVRLGSRVRGSILSNSERSSHSRHHKEPSETYISSDSARGGRVNQTSEDEGNENKRFG